MTRKKTLRPRISRYLNYVKTLRNTLDVLNISKNVFVNKKVRYHEDCGCPQISATSIDGSELEFGLINKNLVYYFEDGLRFTLGVRDNKFILQTAHIELFKSQDDTDAIDKMIRSVREAGVQNVKENL